MREYGDEEKKVAIEFIVECMHCHKQVSKGTVYWPESDAKRLKNKKAVSSGICRDCEAKGKGITE